MNTAPCNCHTQTAKVSLNERPRYYARQLVTPDDLTLEQNYFRARLRRHNRYLHGWGVVCGADVVDATKRDANGQVQPQPWKVIVKSGYVLGPYGDEIFIEADQCVDVRKKCGRPETQDEAECLDEPPTPPQGELEEGWIAIRYVESKTRLVRVPLGGCGCEDNACEYSRFADDYEICVIDHCPESHTNPPRSPMPGREVQGEVEKTTPDCPECQTEPWVVLSAFEVDQNGKVSLQLCDCRRQVLSFGDYWWSCARNGLIQPREDNVETTPAPSADTPAAPAGAKPATTKPAATKPAAKPSTTASAKPTTPATTESTTAATTPSTAAATPPAEPVT